MRVVLPNGVVLEPSTAEELRWVIKEFGLDAFSARRPTTQMPEDQSLQRKLNPHWDALAARTLMVELPGATTKLLHFLIMQKGHSKTAMLARMMELPDARALGAMLATIRKRSEELGRESPVLTSTDPGDGDRALTLEKTFMKALEELGGAERR